ncbi:MAG: winged helix-turn-helix domain-containing protein, partial [Cytophagales bacterium]|nr:winged helix-turn-helix domain-containing protein [Cytophagales bacterium]
MNRIPKKLNESMDSQTHEVMEDLQQLQVNDSWNIKVLHNFRAVIRSEQLIYLTSKEYQLLDYLLRNSGRVLTKEELVNAIWNSGERPNSNSLEVWINQLRKKIAKHFQPTLLHTRLGFGYIFYPIDQLN